MSRVTVTLCEAHYRALNEASAQRDKTVGQWIVGSLAFCSIMSREAARALVQRAWKRPRAAARPGYVLMLETLVR